MNEMKSNKLNKLFLFSLIIALPFSESFSQGQDITAHKRGKLWEMVSNNGYISTNGSWDFIPSWPLGLYPGFDGYMHPTGGEGYAENTFSNANFHNFRSGIWILAKDVLVPGTPPGYTPTSANYEVFLSGNQGDAYGLMSSIDPIEREDNFIENSDFDPLLPEEIITAKWHTNTGITVTRRSYAWSYPDYDDFIIYEYVFKNTGVVVSTLTNQIVEGFPTQTLNDVYFALHSGISVSTKSAIAFHCDLGGVAAGAFGWQPGAYHDYYHIYENGSSVESNGELVFSTNVNGGSAPTPWDPFCIKDGEFWTQKFGDELLSPAAFGWLSLYATPTGSVPRSSAKPDVLRIDSHKGGQFKGKDLDLERFNLGSSVFKQDFYDFVTTPDVQTTLGNTGNRFNFYTLSYGPYTLDHGDSVQIIIAEVAGVMDYGTVVTGDPDGHFPDSTIADILRNAENAKQALQWGIGGQSGGRKVVADVPEPPPGPNTNAVNASVGREKASIAVTWDDIAETQIITDGSGGVFYNGIDDLDGYRIFRSQDFQYVSDSEEPVLRGATWTCLDTITKSEFGEYFDSELGLYKYIDEEINFGFRYGYYVEAYNESPNDWVSANGTTVTNLQTLANGSYNRTLPTAASPGPVTTFDIFVTPNPFIYRDNEFSFGITDPYRIEFRNLPESCTIRIYTLSGDLIRTLEHTPDEIGNVSGSEAWDQKSESGLVVAPGLYIYHVESTTSGLNESLTGKLMLIR